MKNNFANKIDFGEYDSKYWFLIDDVCNILGYQIWPVTLGGE